MEPSAQFLKLLDEFEEQLDRGFFLSFIGKIVVDEKKLFSIVNEMRMLARSEAFKPPAPPPMQSAPADPVPEKAPRPDEETLARLVDKLPESERELAREAIAVAQSVRTGANDYARDVLDKLKGSLQTAARDIERQLAEIERGKKMIETKQNDEVKSHGAT